jgi:hypothetical protein
MFKINRAALALFAVAAVVGSTSAKKTDKNLRSQRQLDEEVQALVVSSENENIKVGQTELLLCIQQFTGYTKGDIIKGPGDSTGGIKEIIRGKPLLGEETKDQITIRDICFDHLSGETLKCEEADLISGLTCGCVQNCNGVDVEGQDVNTCSSLTALVASTEPNQGGGDNCPAAGDGSPQHCCCMAEDSGACELL